MKIGFCTFNFAMLCFLSVYGTESDKSLLNKAIKKYTVLSKGIQASSISAFTLKKELLAGKLITLVDVREKKEQAISMLPHAISKEEFLKNFDQYKNNKIVAYCTIGFRSGKFAEKYKTLNIFNLEGGVLVWSHCGGEFVQNTTKTTRVHVYSKSWNFLNSQYEAVYQ